MNRVLWVAVAALTGWAIEAGAEIVRVECSQIAYTQHWDTSEEALARGGFNGGPYVLGETFLTTGDVPHWQSMSGTLPLRVGIALQGTELVVHKDSTAQAKDCYDWIVGTNPDNDCTRYNPPNYPNGVGDGHVWLTAEGKPTSLDFYVNPPDTFPELSWVMYPTVCRAEEEALGFCSRVGECIFNDHDAGEFGPCPDTTWNVHTIAEMRTSWLGHSQQGGGRWGGVATVALDAPVSNLGVRFNASMRDFVSQTAGTNRNLRIRFYDGALNQIGAHVLRADVEHATRWRAAYGSTMLMDGAEACFADTSNLDAIRAVIVDSVDGQRWALRGVYSDPSYSYALPDVIPQTPCEPPIAGLQVDWDPVTGSNVRDPSPHVANHVFNHHAVGMGGDHLPGEQICSMDCYCSPDPVACCAGTQPPPPPPVCSTFHDATGDGVVGGPDFASFVAEFRCHSEVR